MNRFLLVLSAVIMTLALVACGQQNSQQAAAPTSEPAKASPEASTTPSAAANVAEAPKTAASTAAAKPADSQPKPVMVQVPQGTALTVILTDAISSGKNKAGDTFTATLADPLVVNGDTVFPRGTTVKGKVIEAEESGRIKGKASIELGLTSIVSGGKTYAISTRTFSEEAESTKKRDGGLIAGAGGVGAAIGALAGGGKGALKGAIIGGAAGTGAVLATKGKEVEFPSESKLTFSLTKPVEVSKSR
jgi:hypothetical protein